MEQGFVDRIDAKLMMMIDDDVVDDYDEED